MGRRGRTLHREGKKMTVETTTPEAPAQDDLEAWKAHARKWETRAKASAEEAKTALADLATFTDQVTAFEADIAKLTEANAELTTRAETAETALSAQKEAAEQAEREKVEAEEREALLKDVADEAGVPAAALRGTTREELLAHAETLKPLLTGVGTVIPNQGDTPERVAESEAKVTVSKLFSPDSD